MKIRVESGAQPERLTYAGENIYDLAMAPRGNRFAYAQELTDVDLWQMRPGSSPRSFASSRRFDYYPQYSPDGKHIAFGSDRSGEFEIWVCDADGGNLTQLTYFGTHSGSPRWSPDGSWVAFDHQLKDGWHIFVMASDGGQVRQLTSDEGDQVVPSWSGDGKWIYYASKRTGRLEIWKAPAKGGKSSQVTRHGGWTALESPNGRFLFYTKFIDNQDYSAGLWALPLGGGDERLILQSIGSRAFTVAEDGIYYISSPSADGSAAVRFHDFAKDKSHEITSFKENFAGGLTVSPDRKTILFSVFARTGSNVMVVENFK